MKVAKRKSLTFSSQGKTCNYSNFQIQNTVLLTTGGFLGGSDGKESTSNEEDPGWSLGWEDPLEKEMVTHSSILAWRIPWTEEPGRLQSMGLQRVGHDWATNIHINYCQHATPYILRAYFVTRSLYL